MSTTHKINLSRIVLPWVILSKINRFQAIVFLALALGFSLPVCAQNPLTQLLQPSSQRAASTPGDQLGRDTPYGTVYGFLQAAQSRQLQHCGAVSADEFARAPKRRRCAGHEAERGDEQRLRRQPAAKPAARRHAAGRRSSRPAKAWDHVGGGRGSTAATGSSERSRVWGKSG